MKISNYLPVINKENAILLKKLHYDLPTYLCYSDSDDDVLPYNAGNEMYNNALDVGYYAAPLVEETIKWLRDKHKIYVVYNTFSSKFRAAIGIRHQWRVEALKEEEGTWVYNKRVDDYDIEEGKQKIVTEALNYLLNQKE